MMLEQPDLEMRERYLRDDEPTRFGNLASTLARAARGAQVPSRRETVTRVLREACDFVGWSTQSNDSQASVLHPMQIDLNRLLTHWQGGSEWDADLADEVAVKCRSFSDQALALSGLLDE